MNFRSRALRSGLPARVPARLAGSACVRYYHRQDRQIGLGCIYRRAAAMHGILFQRCLVMPATLRTWTAMRQIMLPMLSGMALSSSRRDGHAAHSNRRDRQSVVYGKSVSVRVDLGGRRFIKKKQKNNI